jgi:hypothetical protein
MATVPTPLADQLRASAAAITTAVATITATATKVAALETAAGTLPPPPPPTVTESPDGTFVTTVAVNGVPSIIDHALRAWTITAGLQVAVAGVTDTNTANVAGILKLAGVMWQVNKAGQWYQNTAAAPAMPSWTGPKSDPRLVVTPPPAVTESPDGTFISTQAVNGVPSVIDHTLRAWTITTGAKVAVAGVTDANTANVTGVLKLAPGGMWHVNAGNQWYQDVAVPPAMPSWTGPFTDPRLVVTPPPPASKTIAIKTIVPQIVG